MSVEMYLIFTLYLSVSLPTMYVSDIFGSQKRSFGTPQTRVMGGFIGAITVTQVLCKSKQCSFYNTENV